MCARETPVMHAPVHLLKNVAVIMVEYLSFLDFQLRYLNPSKSLPLSIPLLLPHMWKCNDSFDVVRSEDMAAAPHLNAIPTALDLLSSIQKPIAVLGICGPYRSGKSYFASQILGLPETFAVGHTTDACTHGIWMATNVLECEDYVLLVLDMEGTAAVGKDETGNVTMSSLLVMTTLISSYLIYNSTNVPQKGNLDEMK